MASNSFESPLYSKKLTLALWLLAIAGLAGPLLVRGWLNQNTWVEEVRASFDESAQQGQWQVPWLSIQESGFGAAWVRCEDLRFALELDQLIDDGRLHSGKLVLAEGGIAWLP